MIDFKPTGITQRIDGYKTQEFVGSVVGGRLTLFMAKDLSLEQKLDKDGEKSLSGPAFDMLRELVVGLENVSGVPIRLVYEGFGLKIAATLESVEDTDLDDRSSRFRRIILKVRNSDHNRQKGNAFPCSDVTR